MPAATRVFPAGFAGKRADDMTAGLVALGHTSDTSSRPDSPRPYSRGHCWARVVPGLIPGQGASCPQ
jgi:hypothetical protein